jgi:anti-sigma regulatory factor (Ser/Thr protein kinase)
MASPSLRFAVPGSFRSLQTAAEQLDLFSAAQNLPVDARWPFHVAIDEVLSNILKYGFGGEDTARQIEIEFELLPDDVFAMTVSDDAPAFDPRQAPEPDTTSPLEERPIGGLGITILKGLMDRIDYERRGDRNILVLRKRIDRKG